MLLLFAAYVPLQAETYELTSPAGQIRLHIQTTDKIYYALEVNGESVMWYSPLSMTLADGQVLGANPKLKKQRSREVRETLTPVWGTRREIADHFNELSLEMEGGYTVLFRAYDTGVAYRFVTDLPGRIRIQGEEVAFRFLKDQDLYAHIVGDFQTSYEKLYTREKISEVKQKDFISLPLLMDQGQVKLAFTEADVYDYPGMYLMRLDENNRHELLGLFPRYPTAWEPGGWCQFNLRVTERADYLAETGGKRAFPWRVTIVATEDHQLAENNLVYQLARPSQIQNTDWIKPGLVSWEWWNAWNLTGVDFETGVNDRTYEYYIDFAAENGLPYVIMDEGWSDQFDLFLQKPGVNVPHLAEYAAERGVKLILWCVWHTLDRQMEPALDMMAEWGIAGVKVDFIDRDDQIAINFYERLAREAAKRQMLVDIHGCSKPTGLHRTYPNLINYEAVRGNEYNKFSRDETPGHNVDLVYTRMLAGPMDYTPGAMRNSTEGNFLMDNENPMSYGTRCHQLGMFVVYFAPLQMLCDAPTAYRAYPDILNFLKQVPVTWDETVTLDGKIGEYIVLARRKGDTWYLGALNNWTEREIEVDLSFLGDGSYEAQLFLDSVNANRKAEDYRFTTLGVQAGQKLRFTLKKGGGMAGVIGRK